MQAQSSQKTLVNYSSDPLAKRASGTIIGQPFSGGCDTVNYAKGFVTPHQWSSFVWKAIGGGSGFTNGINSFNDKELLRDYLVQNIKGIGYKEIITPDFYIYGQGICRCTSFIRYSYLVGNCFQGAGGGYMAGITLQGRARSPAIAATTACREDSAVTREYRMISTYCYRWQWVHRNGDPCSICALTITSHHRVARE